MKKHHKLWDKPHVIILIASSLIMLSFFFKNYFPTHDTLSVFEVFAIFFRELSLSHEIPLWMPYTAYGLPSELCMIWFGPFQIIWLFLGKILSIKNALHAYNLSIIGDYFYLGLGSYLFCHHNFKNKKVALYLVLNLLLLAIFEQQIFFNFKLLLPFPMSLYFAQIAVERLSVKYFLCSYLNIYFWIFGGGIYFFPVQFYTISAFLAPLIYFKCMSNAWQGKTFKKIFMQSLSPQQVFLWLILSLLFVISTYILFGVKDVMFNQMMFSGTNRNADMTTTLAEYLNYGGKTEANKLTEVINGIPRFTNMPYDFISFTGLINVLLAIFGLCSYRLKKVQIALCSSLLFIICFTITKTRVAEFMYIFPGMNLVRHVGYFLPLAKPLIIFLSGYGLRNLMVYIQTHSQLRFFTILGLIVCLINIYTLPHFLNHFYYERALTLSIILMLFLISAYYFKYQTFYLIKGLIFLNLCDIFSYRMVLHDDSAMFNKNMPANYVHISKIKFASSRQTHQTESLIKLNAYGALYGVSGDFLGEDFCPPFRQDIISRGVKNLFDELNLSLFTDFNHLSNDPFNKMLACNAPKIQMTNHVNYVDSLEENKNFNSPIIEHKKTISNTAVNRDETAQYNYKIIHFSPNRITIDVNNLSHSKTWLIYSDAYNKDWHAKIDGKDTPISKANIAFKAVQVEPGQHIINFEFIRSIHLWKIFYIQSVLSTLLLIWIGLHSRSNDA